MLVMIGRQCPPNLFTNTRTVSQQSSFSFIKHIDCSFLYTSHYSSLSSNTHITILCLLCALSNFPLLPTLTSHKDNYYYSGYTLVLPTSYTLSLFSAPHPSSAAT